MFPVFAVDDIANMAWINAVFLCYGALRLSADYPLPNINNIGGRKSAVSNHFAPYGITTPPIYIISGVVGAGSKVKMAWISTGRIIAMMTNDFTVRYFPVRQNHRRSMGRKIFVSVTQLPISRGGYISFPFPTWGVHVFLSWAVFVNEVIKTIFKCIRQGMRWIYASMITTEMEKLSRFSDRVASYNLPNDLTAVKQLSAVVFSRKEKGLSASTPCSRPYPAITTKFFAVGAVFINLIPQAFNIFCGKLYHISISLLDVGRVPGRSSVAGTFLCFNYSIKGGYCYRSFS